MSKSPASPRPVSTGRYRYTRLRWRVSVRILDLVGSILIRLWRLFRPARHPDPPRKILVVQLDHMGDAILTSPIFPRLRAAYPEASIEVLASPSNREIFEADPEVDRVHLADRNWFERRPGRRALGSAVWTLGRTLRTHRFDLGIDVRGDILTVFVLALAGIPRRLGWAMGGGGFLLTDVARWVPARHEVASRTALIDCLGLPMDAPARVRVHATDRDRVRVAQALREAWSDRPGRSLAKVGSAVAVQSVGRSRRVSGKNEPNVWDEPDDLHAGRFGDSAPLLAVHVGAGAAAKRWPTRHWQELVRLFLDDGWRVIVVGGAEDRATASALGTHARLRDWSGRFRITETAALLERADLFIGSDSGPAHLAASASTASVILFSGTNRPGQWRPWSRRALVLRQTVRCRPCHHKVCPLADHPCMAGLEPDRVYRAARRWWARLHREESPHVPI
ncbi:glycosyltransferase family 9 protein [Tundrisphaera lichenicola]|uniref:glycosyltransferase family 9 protein n=1 Tax=Tundrisphaera lichenicola TaxID=2029860 RepID=UPI003EC07679